LTGTLTLNSEGSNSAVFIFKIGSALTTASSSSIVNTNGGTGCGVFWQVGSSAVLGTSTAFVGDILALASITVATGASIAGAAQARNGAVTLDTNHVGIPSTCIPPPKAECQSAVAQTYASMSSSTAVKNAQNSGYYTQGVVSYFNPTYNSIFEIAKTTVPYPTCTEEVQSFNVVFALHTSDGAWARYLVITENQALTVIGSDYQTDYGNASPGPQGSTGFWSGYEVQTSSSSPATILIADSDFTEPTPSYPSTGCEDSDACAMVTWVGLTDRSQAGLGNLAQDGTLSACVSSTCNGTHYAWYQLLGVTGKQGNPWTQCTSSTGGAVTITAGDTIYAQTENDYYNGGSSTNYDFYVEDVSNGTSCLSNGNSYTQMSSPTYGEFIVENPIYCNGFSNCGNGCGSFGNPPTTTCDSLPEFNTVPFSGAEIYSTHYGYINAYSFPTSSITMHNEPDDSSDTWGSCDNSNGFTTNASPGSLSGYGDFTVSWSSSQYTPFSDTGC
jgi:hypothetical protein